MARRGRTREAHHRQCSLRIRIRRLQRGRGKPGDRAGSRGAPQDQRTERLRARRSSHGSHCPGVTSRSRCGSRRAGSTSLIGFVTNIAFYGRISGAFVDPAGANPGILRILVAPLVGAFIVEIMARYGSAAIRGHGIPEAMEQVLTNGSRIRCASCLSQAALRGHLHRHWRPVRSRGAHHRHWRRARLGCGSVRLQPPLENVKRFLRQARRRAWPPRSAVLFRQFSWQSNCCFSSIARARSFPSRSAATVAAGIRALFHGTAPVFDMANVSSPSGEALAVYALIGLAMGFAAAGINASDLRHRRHFRSSRKTIRDPLDVVAAFWCTRRWNSRDTRAADAWCRVRQHQQRLERIDCGARAPCARRTQVHFLVHLPRERNFGWYDGAALYYRRGTWRASRRIGRVVQSIARCRSKCCRACWNGCDVCRCLARLARIGNRCRAPAASRAPHVAPAPLPSRSRRCTHDYRSHPARRPRARRRPA